MSNNLEQSTKELYEEARSILLPILKDGIHVKVYLDEELKNLSMSLIRDFKLALEPYKELIKDISIDYFKVSEKYRKGNRINFEVLLDDRLVDKNRRHLEVYITNKGIYDPERPAAAAIINYITGIGIITYSTKNPFINFKKIVTHEFGHQFGLQDHKNWKYKGCAMYKDADSVIKLVTKGTFCKECESQLRKMKNLLFENKFDEFIYLLIKHSQ